MLRNFIILMASTVLIAAGLRAQPGTGNVDLAVPSDYRIAGLTVLGADYTDVQAVKLFSGLQVGDEITIPGDRLSDAVRNLWDQRLFSDVSIELAERRDRDVYLVIRVEEMPRLTRYGFTGVRRGEQETLRGKLDLVRGQIVNENLKVTTRRILEDHYREKGFFDAQVTITSTQDSVLENAAGVNIDIVKGEKIKVGVIRVEGSDALSEKILKRRMKNTKERAWCVCSNPQSIWRKSSMLTSRPSWPCIGKRGTATPASRETACSGRLRMNSESRSRWTRG